VLFSQTVPRHLVHRNSDAEVFVTDLRVTGYNTFEVGVRWPGSHSFYGPSTPYSHDPILLLESLRQAGLLIAHVAFEVPADFQFITHEKQFDIDKEGLYTNGTEPVDLLLTVTAQDIRRRGRGFAGMRFDYRCHRDGREIASATIRWSCVSAAGYARLRGEHYAVSPTFTCDLAPVGPHLVSRTEKINVMIAEAPGGAGWVLRLDPDHSVVFDHSVDHVPGMAAIEAARQAALLVLGQPGALPIRGEFSFLHYIEFDKPCAVLAKVERVGTDGATPVRILLEQDGRTAGQGVFEFRT
jgi:hypothetical protein